MTYDGTADLTVDYYFDPQTNLPIAAHYYNFTALACSMTVTIRDSVENLRSMQLLLNLTEEELATGIVKGAINLNYNTSIDSYYFFDTYFNI